MVRKGGKVLENHNFTYTSIYERWQQERVEIKQSQPNKVSSVSLIQSSELEFQK